MPSKVSAGLLPYRKTPDGSLEVLLAHYGGPLWARKDLRSWTVVKGETRQTTISDVHLESVAGRSPALPPEADSAGGEVEEGEDLLQTAKREFQEETGIDVSNITEFTPLGEITQRGGKTVHAWAFESSQVHYEYISEDQRLIRVNLRNVFEMEWPPRSGKIQQFPEIDKAEWFSLDIARQKINPAQVPFLDRLSVHLSS